MLLKGFGKLLMTAVLALSVILLAAAGQTLAFSVDVKKLYYADNANPETLKRVVNYDFSDGTLSNDTITIPGSFVTPDPTFDTGLTYIFGPYPDPSNDVAVTLDTVAGKATLTSTQDGGCIISTSPNLPALTSAVPQWDFSVQLTHFTGMTDNTKMYSAEIGFGSDTEGPHPEFTATWAPGGAGRVLVLQAEIYNDGNDQTEWSLISAPITGLDPAAAFIELRVSAVPNVAQGYLDIKFQYRFSDYDNWIDLGTRTIGPPPPAPPFYLSFPAWFPYVALDNENFASAPDYSVYLMNNKITVIKGETAEFVLGVQFHDYTSTQGVSFASDTPALGAVFTPAPVKNNGGTVMKINTAGLNAGIYQANVLYGEGTTDAGSIPFTLEVLTVADIKFFELDQEFNKIYITEKALNFQGQFGEISGVSYEVQTYDGKIVPNSDSGVILTSLNPGVVGAFQRYWGYDLYSRANGAATLRAQAPDGTYRDLAVTVAIPGDAPQITSIGLIPDMVSNKGTDTILFQAISNAAPNRISGWGADTSGYINLNFDFMENTVLSGSDTQLDSTFHITNPPADLGTVILYASASRDGYPGATAAVDMTTVNDPTYSGLRMAFKPVDPSIFGGDMFDIEFYTPADTTTPAFAKMIFSMHVGMGAPIEVGGITPGTYKIRFVSSGGGVLPQWWPNSNDPANAEALVFTAGQFVDDIFFFARAVPTLSFTGAVKEGGNNFPNVAVPGAAVDVYASTYVPGTATDENGAFTLSGIPQGQNFELNITKDGFTPVYSEIFNWNENIQALLPYGLFPTGALTTWGVTTGNGAIFGRVSQVGNPTGYLSGATVAAVNAADSGQTYAVTYMSTEGVFGGTATYANGVFAVLNVPAGVTVKLTVSLTGWTFAQPISWVTVRDGALGETSFFGTAEVTETSISGTVSAGSSGYTSGNIYVAVYASPWPSLNRVAATMIAAPGAYSIAGLPADTDLYVYARWDKDGSGTRTPGDWTGQYLSNPVVITGGANPTGVDITLAGEVAGASVSGYVTSSEFAPGFGNLIVAAYDGPDTATANLLKTATILSANVSGTAIPYTLTGLAANGYVFLFARWDKDGNGTPSAGDVRGGYSFNPLPAQPGENTGINIALFSATPSGDALAGTWGVLHLQYEVGPHNWFSEASRVTFNGDGTGILTGVKNDEMNYGTADQIKPFGFPFTYTLGSNADGSLALTMTVPTDEGAETFSSRVVPSDNGNMAVMDGTGDPEWIKLSTLIKIDTARTYSITDFDGIYYGVGYERNRGTIVDPPNGNGAFMAISSVETYNGSAGTYSYYGYANSVLSNGSAQIWNDPGFGEDEGTYNVSPDGTVSVQGGAFRGFLTGNGALGIGAGSFGVDVPGSWVQYAFLKKGDRAYTTADLEGKWALVGFGDENESNQVFISSIGTMICDTGGACSYKFKNHISDGGSDISSGNAAFTVAADGSFGASLPGSPPAYAGAIGNDGNTVIFNASFDQAETWHREIIIGVRASNVGDLAGDVNTEADETAIRANFDAMITAFNSQDIDTFMSFVLANYLHDGMNKEAFRAEVLSSFGETLPVYTLTVNVVGGTATMVINWSGEEPETWHWLKVGDVWRVYGNQLKYDISAWSGHTAESYWVSMSVEDPDDAIISVSVTGPGISGSINLVHNTADKRWVSWPIAPPYTNFGPEFGTTPPTPPLTYTFTITDGQGNTTAMVPVNNFVEVFATPVSPASGETLSDLTSFEWTGVGAGYRYRIELSDSSWARLWDSDYDGTTGNSLLYTGGPLVAGSYSYNLLTENFEGNFSMVTVPFSIAPPMGDINGDGNLTLADAILALKIISGKDSTGVTLSGDVNGDGRIGFAELVYILQKVGGVRP